jgi:hypothetical protein
MLPLVSVSCVSCVSPSQRPPLPRRPGRAMLLGGNVRDSKASDPAPAFAEAKLVPRPRPSPASAVMGMPLMWRKARMVTALAITVTALPKELLALIADFLLPFCQSISIAICFCIRC